MSKDINVPTDWTFKSADVAKNFDTHVRSQLPWYELATNMMAHFGRHYLPEEGLMYDIGASTGNVTKTLSTEIGKRRVRAISIDNSPQMVEVWQGVGEIVCADAFDYPYKPYDVAVCFLVLMFLSPEKQGQMFDKLYSQLKPGGALIIFDKTDNFNGYLNTVVHRMTIAGKVATNTPSEDIVKKELSLAGAQRPIQTSIFNLNTFEIFRFGEFAGWVAVK